MKRLILAAALAVTACAPAFAYTDADRLRDLVIIRTVSEKIQSELGCVTIVQRATPAYNRLTAAGWDLSDEDQYESMLDSDDPDVRIDALAYLSGADAAEQKGCF